MDGVFTIIQGLSTRSIDFDLLNIALLYSYMHRARLLRKGHVYSVRIIVT